MDYILTGHEYHHDVYTVIQLFFPNLHYSLVNELSDGLTVQSIIEGGVCRAVVNRDKIPVAEHSLPLADSPGDQINNVIKTTVFECMKRLTGITPPWGILTGIRPTKKVHLYKSGGTSEEKISEIFENDYFVTPKKSRLCIETARAEERVLSSCTAKDVSLYVGIPFCPTRCLYCSFTSYPAAKYAHIMPEYVECLKKELSYISAKIKSRGERLKSVYIGGGTPTSLDENLTERLLSGIAENFDLEAETEFSYEAGRPDTITPGKLKLMKKYGVNRISVNPQSMNPLTLEKIGRLHSVESFLRAYGEALDIGFKDINIDIILGLPGETVFDVNNTLEKILSLKPNTLTAHALSVKRAARLKEELSEHELSDFKTLDDMVDLCYSLCKSESLEPYYMYRQKNTLGNFENVGYAKYGRECVYNIVITEEKQTVYAAGAGSVTKVYYPEENRLERAFNVKNVDEYIQRTDEMLRRKDVLL